MLTIWLHSMCPVWNTMYSCRIAWGAPSRKPSYSLNLRTSPWVRCWCCFKSWNFLAFSHNSLLYSLILRSVRGSLLWSFKTFSVKSPCSFVMQWMSRWINLCFRMKPRCLSVWNRGKCHMVSGNREIQSTYLLEAESFVWIRKFGITISTYVHMFIEFFHFTS